MEDLDHRIKKERLNKLLVKKAERKKDFQHFMYGKTEEFIFEENIGGYGEGYPGNYIRWYVKDYNGDSSPKKVVIKEPYGDGALAEIIKD